MWLKEIRNSGADKSHTNIINNMWQTYLYNVFIFITLPFCVSATLSLSENQPDRLIAFAAKFPHHDRRDTSDLCKSCERIPQYQDGYQYSMLRS